MQPKCFSLLVLNTRVGTRPAALCLFLCSVVATLGCNSTKQSNTARTAREQLLLSNAVDQALAKIDFSNLQGTNVFLEDKYLECIDKGYIMGSIRHRAMVNGANLVAKADDADIVMELRSGGVGTDQSDAFVGSPEIVLPGMLTLPEVRFISRVQQTATAKIGLVAYDPKSKQLLGEGGVSSSKSDDTNLFVLGVGPYQSGSVKQEIRTTTPRYANQPNQILPAQVAFRDARPIGNSESRGGEVRLTNEQKEASEVK